MNLAPKFNMKDYQEKTTRESRSKQKSVSLIRYADDFVILHEQKEVIEQLKTEMEKWLSDMGIGTKPS